jgi:hypothetical protein
LLKDAMQEIRSLNPRPGAQAGSINKAEQYIIPDFFVYNNNGEPELTLNQRNAPDLRVSDEYRDMLKDYEKGSKKDKRQKEAVVFIRQKIDAAKWFIDAIKQRQQTLLLTMQAIIEHQRSFFLSGDENSLRPMILKDIAEKTRLDDVFAEHQRDGSHCSDSYVTSACAQLQLPPRACLRSACIAVRRPKRQPQVPLLVRAHQQLIRRVAALQTPHVSIGGLSCILRPSGPAKRSSFERRL